MLKIADGMMASWSKSMRRGWIVIPFLLIATWLGLPEFVGVLLGMALVGGQIIWNHFESGRFFCRKCSAQLHQQMKLGPMQFKCPDCRTIYDTDCQIDYAGGPPRKVG